MTLQPFSYQEDVLKALETDRKKGKTLVVLPPGSGKTLVAAFDSKQMKAKSVLYIAHRTEILKQAMEIFASIHNMNKDDLGFLDQNHKDYDKDFIFASNQTLAKKKNLDRVLDKKWDYIVIDEFHHVPAKTYQTIIERANCKFMLGLTATPFRLDNKDIHKYVDNNLTYEINLEEGIKQDILVPFLYNGLYDNIDYSDIEWLGYKYRENDLNKKLLIDKRDNQIVEEFKNYCGIRSTIGFCVSVKHCERITKKFNDAGISSRFITYATPIEERSNLVGSFKNKEFQILFVRDVFNEGVDFPFVEALLFLRPTWSKTVFFQQIGRGLRKAEGKTDVIILDFIGNYYNAYRIKDWLGFAKGSEFSLHHRPTKPTYKHNVAKVYFDKTLIDIFEYQKRLMEPVTPEALKSEYYRMKQVLGRQPTSLDFTPKGLKRNRLKYGFYPKGIAKVETT